MAIHALFVAVNDYPGTGLDLSACVQDAQDWAAEIEPVAKSYSVLLNADATKERILGAAAEMLAKLRPDDWFIWCQSSHGSWIPDTNGDEPDGRDEVLCPYDYQNPIIDDEIHTLISQRAPGSRVLLLTDTCHSGTVYRMALGELFAGLAPVERKIRFMEPARFLGPAYEEYGLLAAKRVRIPRGRPAPGVVHLGGCGETEYAFEAGRNGAFTAAALQALKRMRPGSKISTWYEHIREYLPSYGFPQTPKLNAMAADAALGVPWRV